MGTSSGPARAFQAALSLTLALAAAQQRHWPPPPLPLPLPLAPTLAGFQRAIVYPAQGDLSNNVRPQPALGRRGPFRPFGTDFRSQVAPVTPPALGRPLFAPNAGGRRTRPESPGQLDSYRKAMQEERQMAEAMATAPVGPPAPAASAAPAAATSSFLNLNVDGKEYGYST